MMSFSLRGGLPYVQATAHPLPAIHARVLRDGIEGPWFSTCKSCWSSPSDARDMSWPGSIMAASFLLCCDRVPGEAPSQRFHPPKGSPHSHPRTCVNSPLKESSELREVYFSRLFDIYLSHLLAVTQLLAEVIQPIQTAEIQGQRATFARFPHPDGGSRAQMFRKFRGQILSGQRGS